MDNSSPSKQIDADFMNLVHEINLSLLNLDQEPYEDAEESSDDTPNKGLENLACSPPTQHRRPSNMTDKELKDLPICELNRLLRDYEAHEARELKRRRRCFKNREYAVSARLKRVRVQDDLERENDKLKEELYKAKEEQTIIIAERDMYQKKSIVLEAAWTSLSQCVDQANADSSEVSQEAVTRNDLP